MIIKTSLRTLLGKLLATLILSLPFVIMMNNALATPSIMNANGAPECATCHTNGIFNAASGQAGLAAFLASKTPTCIPPEILQNNVCVTPPPPSCPLPQVLQNNVCVTPSLTCTAPQVVKNSSCVTPPPLATVVRILTSMGSIDIHLFDTAAPKTVANFLSYVTNNSYNNSFFQRSVPNVIIQGGGFVWDEKNKSVKPIVTGQPVLNEFSVTHSNLRGTIAMAKLNNDPDSATSQWFFNLKDNSANLDNQNGGFTVFGQASEKSMAVVDAIAALPVGNASKLKNVKNLKNASAALKKLPLAAPLNKALLKSSNLVLISSVTSNHANVNASDSDRLFAYLEATYPENLSPANALSPANSGSVATVDNYYRYYPATHSYIATANGTVYYRDSKDQVNTLGSLLDLLALAVAAGY